MKLEADKTVGNIAEFVGKVARSARGGVEKHIVGLSYAGSALLIIPALIGSGIGFKNNFSGYPDKTIEQKLALEYRNLPSQQVLDETFQAISVFDAKAISKLHAELEKGNAIVDFSQIGGVREVQENIVFTRQNHDIIIEREKLKQRMTTNRESKDDILGVGGLFLVIAGLALWGKVHDHERRKKSLVYLKHSASVNPV